MEELCPILSVPYKFQSSQHNSLAEINVCCLSCNKPRPHWPVMTTFKIWPQDWPYIILTKFLKNRCSRLSYKLPIILVPPSGQNWPNSAHPFPVSWQPRISNLVLIALSLTEILNILHFYSYWNLFVNTLCIFWPSKILLITLDQVELKSVYVFQADRPKEAKEDFANFWKKLSRRKWAWP